MADTYHPGVHAPMLHESGRPDGCRETYGSKRWPITAACVAQGVLMGMAGAFLIANLRIAPQLATQAAILGGLLIAGGGGFLIHALAGATSHLTVDSQGVRGRFGWSASDIAWSNLRQWRVSDHSDHFAGLEAAEFWPYDDSRSWSIPGGFLDQDDRRRLQTLLVRYAPDKERISMDRKRNTTDS